MDREHFERPESAIAQWEAMLRDDVPRFSKTLGLMRSLGGVDWNRCIRTHPLSLIGAIEVISRDIKKPSSNFSNPLS